MRAHPLERLNRRVKAKGNWGMEREKDNIEKDKRRKQKID